MILNNYWQWKAWEDAAVLYGSEYAGEDTTEEAIGIVDITGIGCTIFQMRGDANNSLTYDLGVPNHTLCVELHAIVGDSDTIVSEWDYNLGHSLMDQISSYTENFSYNSSTNNSYNIVCTISGVNNSGSTIHIREIGIHKGLYTTRRTPGVVEKTIHQFLLVRELLENPIDVPPNRGFTITFEWVMGADVALNNFTRWMTWKNSNIITRNVSITAGVYYKSYDIGLTNMLNGATYKFISDITRTISKDRVSQTLMKNWCWNYGLGIVLGDGVQTVSPNDYILDHDITDQFANIKCNFNWNGEANLYRMVVTVTGTNVTGTTQTINEVGITKTLQVTQELTDWTPDVYDYKFLMVRTLLENPIVVSPGSNFSLTIEWVQS